ncbi:MAG: hypothetical protein E8D49_08360 [Nitrospira sp.]|nr:MAG: hypothetical protein E8D49_08360 [Nitrospira sp.]
MRRQGAVAVLTLLFVQGVLSSLVFAQTTIIPSLTVSERYDSNIFFVPKSLLAPGSKPEDFITSVPAQLNVTHEGSLISGSLFGTGIVTKYLNNPSRDFIGWNVGGRLDLTNAATQVSQRITSLSVRGSYRSTPATTGFGAAGGGLGTGFGSTSGGVLEAGQVTNRASRQIYNLGVTGGYQLTGLTTLNAAYDFTRVSFGEQDAQSGGVTNTLFDTTVHRGTTTISTRISLRDTVGATAAMSHFIQEDSSGISGSGSFTTITETLNWSRLWTQQLRTTLKGGGSLKLPVGSDIPGQSTKSQLVPTVSATMTYTSFSDELRDVGASDGLPSLAGSLAPGGIVPPGAYTATMSYRFSLVPSIAFGAGPLKTHVVGIIATGGITSKLSGQVGMNYSHGTRSAPTSTFDTIGLTAGARYLIGPVLASLTYNWLFFSREADPSLSSQSTEYEFSKKMVLLSFSYAFMSPSFFREGISFPSGGGAGSSPSGDGSEILRKE